MSRESISAAFSAQSMSLFLESSFSSTALVEDLQWAATSALAAAVPATGSRIARMPAAAVAKVVEEARVRACDGYGCVVLCWYFLTVKNMLCIVFVI